MSTLLKVQITIIAAVLIVFQWGIALAQESLSLKTNKVSTENSSEKHTTAQQSANKLHRFINSHENIMFTAKPKAVDIGIASDSIAKQYMKILTQKLAETELELDKLSGDKVIKFDNEGFAMYQGTVMELRHIKRAMLVASAWNAGAVFYKRTELSKKIKRLEKKIARYSVVEYSKSASNAKARLFMPGELDEEQRKEEKEYQVSFSSLFTPDDESLDMDLKVNLNTLFYKTRAVSSYSFVKEEAELSFSNQELNSFNGVDMGISLIKKKRSPPIYLFRTGLNF